MKKWSWLVAPAIVISLAAAPAMAGGGKGKGGSGAAPPAGTLSVDPGSPKYGDTVMFHANMSGVPSNADLLVGLKCYQGDVWVYQLQEPLSSGFPLGGTGVSSPWTGGAAFCTADLFYFTYTARTESGTVYVANTTFNVSD